MAQARALGLPETEIASLHQAAAERPALRVWEENWPVLRLFLAMATQWRHAGMAGLPVGLDYAALPVVAGALELVLDGALLRRLRAMEDAYVLAVLEQA